MRTNPGHFTHNPSDPIGRFLRDLDSTADEDTRRVRLDGEFPAALQKGVLLASKQYPNLPEEIAERSGARVGGPPVKHEGFWYVRPVDGVCFGCETREQARRFKRDYLASLQGDE